MTALVLDALVPVLQIISHNALNPVMENSIQED